MAKDRIFLRTEVGNELLKNPKGRISGDEMLLMALIDGKTGVKGIIKKIPPSVREKLDGVFAHLLFSGFIEEIGIVSTGMTGQHRQVDDKVSKDHPVGKECAELERELEEVKAQLEATRIRQKEIEVVFHKLRLRTSAYTEIMHAKLNKRLKVIAGGEISGEELRASCERELKDALEGLQPLNHAVAEQQDVLDKTLRLKVSAKQLEKQEKEREEESGKLAQSHPYYMKLRGLDFFKGFANAELLQFMDISKLQKAESGEAILNEGDVGMPFYIIISGSVSIYKHDVNIASLEQGDFFGEFAYLSGEEPYRTARVVADTACDLMMVDPLDIEFAPVQLRLHVVEALLRGLVRRSLVSSKPLKNLAQDGAGKELDMTSK